MLIIRNFGAPTDLQKSTVFRVSLRRPNVKIGGASGFLRLDNGSYRLYLWIVASE